VTTNSDRPIFSFAIVADTHLTGDEELNFEGGDEYGTKLATMYDDLIKRVNAMKPSFVVHLGDITDPVPTSPAFADSAEAFHSASNVFDMPYYLAPGNHDIGEKLHPALPKIDENVSITKRAIDKYEQHFGKHRYSFEHDGCLFLVINSMLHNSGLEEEQEQWNWLVETLEENDGKRIFVFAHYPMYLSSRDEPDFYDNIDEPARTNLIELLERHKVEGYYAGHVHNYFYDYLNGMHHFALPSTGIIRTDYMEFFRTTPTRDMGSFDPAKLGFFWVDVYADRHVPHLIRACDEQPYRTHSWNNTASTVTMDLRMAWCDKVDIPSAWGLEIFERKHVRNDYPLAALWEMGIKDLRIPISDLMDPHVSSRVRQLTALGHKFTIVMMGLPNERRHAALIEHSAGIKAVEIVALFDQWLEFAAPLKKLREETDFEIYLNAVRPEVEGWTTHHGMHADLTEEIDWVLEQTELKDAVDGFVFGIRRDKSPIEGYQEIQNKFSNTDYKFHLHVPCVDMFWAAEENDEKGEKEELARVAEASLLAQVNPDISVVIDNFVEIDRGYCSCHGLVDRFYNPKEGSRVITSLSSLLPNQLQDLRNEEFNGTQSLVAESDGGKVILVSGESRSMFNKELERTSDEIAAKQGRLVNLVSGREVESNLQELIANRATDKKAQSPMLLFLEN